MSENRTLAHNHFSVDCVVLGFDGEKLCVLLVRRTVEEEGKTYHDMKLPGSLIYTDEDLDEAAKRVLVELTGLKNINLRQFKAYGSKNRTNDPKDVNWLERAQKERVERIVTVAYVSLIKISRSIETLDGHEACWVPVDNIPALAFDHNVIVRDAAGYIKMCAAMDHSILFNLLPRRFTAAQMRRLEEVIGGRPLDAKNYHKRLAMMPYVVPLDEKEKGVAHRAARYYKFDKVLFKKTRI